MEADDRIRWYLERTPQGGPSFEPHLEGVLGRATSRRRRRRVGAGILTVLVLAGVALPLFLLYGLRGHQGSAVVSPVRPVFASQIRVHGAVDVVATVDTVWVSGFGAVSRIDPVTDRVVARITTPGVEDFSSIATGGGSVWVTADKGVVYRIDPATNRVVATIQAGGNVGGIAVGGGLVWVTQETAGPGDLIRIDPATNHVTGQPVTVGPGPKQVVYGFGAVWVENTSPPSVMRIDPVTYQVTTVPITGSLAVGYGSVWAASGDALTRLDPETGRVVASERIPRAGKVAVGGGEVWVLGFPRSNSTTLFYPIKGTAALWEVDPGTNRIVGGPAQIGALQPIAVSATDTTVWVADYNGQTVTRFDLVQQTAPSPTASTTSSPTSTPPSGWVRHTESSEGVSIDTPADWGFNTNPAPGLAQPLMLFATGTGPVPSGGDCAPTAALKALPPDGVLLTLVEYPQVDEPYTFPPRPARFDLGPLLGPMECWGVKTNTILFEDGGRYFQAQVVFGPNAPSSLRDDVTRSLDSISVDPLPASQQLAVQCRAGKWTSCPEAAWVFEVMDRAHVFHLGHLGTRAILASVGSHPTLSFALWTTRPNGPIQAANGCDSVDRVPVCRVGGGLVWRVQGLLVWAEPAPSPYSSLRTRPAPPAGAVLERIVSASRLVPYTTGA